MDSNLEKPMRSRRGLELATILVFAATLLAPNVDSFLRSDAVRGPRIEQRTPAERPKAPTSLADLNLWPSRFEQYFNDSFGLRDFFLHAYNWLRMIVLHTPTGRGYVLGDGEWIFVANDGALDDFRGLSPLDEHELEAWKHRLEARRDWLASRGIRYLFVVAPNKESIYPEHYDPRYERLGPTRLDQLSKYLAEHSDVDFVDLRGALLEEKRRIADSEPLYSPTGTHWIGRGAAFAAQRIAERVARYFPNVHPLQFDELQPSYAVPVYDSLLPALYLQRNTRLRVPVYHKKGVEVHDFGANADRTLAGRHVSTQQADTTLPTAMIFHDSFVPYAEQLIAESFSELTLDWHYGLDTEEIETIHPDVVLEIVVERMLSYPTLFDFTPPSGGRSWKDSKEFVGSYVPSRDSPTLETSRNFAYIAFQAPRDDFLRVESTGGESWIEFPAAMLGDGRNLTARLDLQAREACDATISFECRGGGPARVNRPLRLEAGRNIAYFDFDGDDVQGTMRLHWSGANTLLVRTIVVRRVAR